MVPQSKLSFLRLRGDEPRAVDDTETASLEMDLSAARMRE
jgi:hypothetical protein